MSHKSTIRYIDVFGANHDDKVLEWKQDLLMSMGSDNDQVNYDCIFILIKFPIKAINLVSNTRLAPFIYSGAMDVDVSEDESTFDVDEALQGGFELHRSEFRSSTPDPTVGSQASTADLEDGIDDTCTCTEPVEQNQQISIVPVQPLESVTCSEDGIDDTRTHTCTEPMEQNQQISIVPVQPLEIATCSEDGIDDTCTHTCTEPMEQNQQISIVPVQPLESATCSTTTDNLVSVNVNSNFKIVFDNINASVAPRYMSCDNQKTCHNYVHVYAVKDRVDLSGLSRIKRRPPDNLTPKDIAVAILPSIDDDKSVLHNFAIIISRILVTQLPFFKLVFEDVVEWHIPNKFSKEMSCKSEVVSNYT